METIPVDSLVTLQACISSFSPPFFCFVFLSIFQIFHTFHPCFSSYFSSLNPIWPKWCDECKFRACYYGNCVCTCVRAFVPKFSLTFPPTVHLLQSVVQKNSIHHFVHELAEDLCISQVWVPIYTKHQRLCCENSAMTLAILFLLKTMELLQNGVANHFEVTPLFSMRTVLLASSQSFCSIDANTWCKWALNVPQ